MSANIGETRDAQTLGTTRPASCETQNRGDDASRVVCGTQEVSLTEDFKHDAKCALVGDDASRVVGTQEVSARRISNTTQDASSPTDASPTFPQLSVIVPVYKVEKFLAECIESVLAQTFTDFEMILVDDGSPDNSGKICDDFAARDPRIRVFHKENGGVSSARNLGLDNARGEWLAFVDADDTVRADYLKNLWGEKPPAGTPVEHALQVRITR